MTSAPAHENAVHDDGAGEVGLQARMDGLLRALVEDGGYHAALICTDEGLLVAGSGDEVGGTTEEELAGTVSLFDGIVQRADRDLAMSSVDEVTMLDDLAGRMVIRPVEPAAADPTTRFFLVVRVPRRATWRRNTNRLVRQLRDLLATVEA